MMVLIAWLIFMRIQEANKIDKIFIRLIRLTKFLEVIQQKNCISVNF